MVKGVEEGEVKAESFIELVNTVYHKTDDCRNIGIKNMCRLPLDLLFFSCKTQWFQICDMVHVNYQVWSSTTVIWSLPNKNKNWAIWAMSVSLKWNIKSNDFKLVLSRQPCQRHPVLNYVWKNGLGIKKYSTSFVPS